jgi:AmmeMemoRadiSam system protein B
MRKAAYNGFFYPKTTDALNKAIEECFTGKLGPGALPTKPKLDSFPVKAIISPHAGYVFSGMAAAWSYMAVAEAPLPDLFILLGPSHRAGHSGISMDSFETPLGIIRVDQDFAKALVKKGNIKLDEAIHEKEHSLEVQLPFLQFSLGNRAEKIKILPFLVSDDLDLGKAASDLRETITELKRTVTFIVSSDFTHYGPEYGYVPFTSDLKERLSKLDGEAINLIKKGDADGFAAYVYKTGATICGQFAITLLLKTIKFKQALLEQYYTSGEITGNYKNSVSYVSLVFR